MAEKKYGIGERLGESLRQTFGQKPSDIPPANIAQGIQDVTGITAANKVLSSFVPGTSENRALTSALNPPSILNNPQQVGESIRQRLASPQYRMTGAYSGTPTIANTAASVSKYPEIDKTIKRIAPSLQAETPQVTPNKPVANMGANEGIAGNFPWIPKPVALPSGNDFVASTPTGPAPAIDTTGTNQPTVGSIFGAMPNAETRQGAVQFANAEGHTFTNADLEALYGKSPEPTGETIEQYNARIGAETDNQKLMDNLNDAIARASNNPSRIANERLKAASIAAGVLPHVQANELERQKLIQAPQTLAATRANELERQRLENEGRVNAAIAAHPSREKFGVAYEMVPSGEYDEFGVEKMVRAPRLYDQNTGQWLDRQTTPTKQTTASPYPDGTKLRGKDGKMYIVKNGEAVLNQ